jgi:hypothetical protein
MELFRRIAVLYSIAYEWNGGDSMTAEATTLANGCEKRNVPVRDFVRRALLLLEQRRSAAVS